jgi:hypothetical protein
MLRDLLSKSQSDSDQGERQENRQPTLQNFNASLTKPHKDDDEFVPVNHEDVEAVDDEEDESEMERVLRPFLGLQRQGQRTRAAAPNKYDDLHPYTQILSLSNLEACVALEQGTFPEHERCSRDKVRLAPSLHFISTQILASQRSNGSRSRTNVIVGSQMSPKIAAKVVCNSREAINLPCSHLTVVCLVPLPADCSSYPSRMGRRQNVKM